MMMPIFACLAMSLAHAPRGNRALKADLPPLARWRARRVGEEGYCACVRTRRLASLSGACERLGVDEGGEVDRLALELVRPKFPGRLQAWPQPHRQRGARLIQQLERLGEIGVNHAGERRVVARGRGRQEGRDRERAVGQLFGVLLVVGRRRHEGRLAVGDEAAREPVAVHEVADRVGRRDLHFALQAHGLTPIDWLRSLEQARRGLRRKGGKSGAIPFARARIERPPAARPAAAGRAAAAATA